MIKENPEGPDERVVTLVVNDSGHASSGYWTVLKFG